MRALLLRDQPVIRSHRVSDLLYSSPIAFVRFNQLAIS
jgi:hypothetical protein